MNGRTLYIPYPDPILEGAPACYACDGKGKTGEMFGQVTTTGVTLVVDVFCPGCGGCGRGEHDRCHPYAHGLDPYALADGAAGLPADLLGALEDAHLPVGGDDLAAFVLADGHELDTDDDDQDDDEAGACPSCRGRTWNAVSGFSGEGTNVITVVLRMPCGCVEARAVELTE